MDNKKDNKPLQTAVETFHHGVGDMVNAVASVPDAVARGVATTLHGKDAVEKAVGEFDPHPVNTLLERVKNSRPSDKGSQR